MNDALISLIKRSGESVYSISKHTGIPYTTINELKNQKKDINSCSALSVYLLAEHFHVNVGDLLNEAILLDGVSGEYKGIKYTWSSDGECTLAFKYNNQLIEINTHHKYNIPKRFFAYATIAEWTIQDYLDELEWEEKATKLLKERGLLK